MRYCAFFLMLLSVLVRAQDHQTKPNNNTTKSQATQSATQPAPIIIQVPSTQRTEQEAAEDKRRADDESAIKHRELALTVVIAIAAAVQAGGILWQIFIYRKQSDLMAQSLSATEKSADAALLNAQALITSERPLLLVGPGNRGYPPSALSLEAENFGKSPAEILFTQFNHLILPISDEPEFKNPPWINDRLLAHREWLIPGADPHEIGILHFLTLRTAVPEIVTEVQSGQKVIWLFGQIRYRGPLRNEVYESRFCYLWTPKGGYVMGGPAGYNDCT